MKTLTKIFKQDKEKFSVPKSVQDIVPVKAIWEDGIFLVGNNKYSKSFKFIDINYAVASREDKEAMFLDYSELLNALDTGATTKITINNRRINKLDFEKTILLKDSGDELDKYRKEYNQMLLSQAKKANEIVQEKIITISIYKKSIDEARSYFARAGSDLITHFATLGSKCVELDAEERLRIAHDFYRTGEETSFHFDISETMKKGHNFKDFICPDTAEFESKAAFTGCELVSDTHRLAMMNALLHDINSKIDRGDTLSPLGKTFNNYDVVLTNPPFGTKKGGERATRDDLSFATSNKQLNFLQHIYRSLKANGKARAAVVLPDNVLFADNDGEKIRVDLMDKCNLHTILRLPTGIFYAKGVQTNVLFFTRGASDKGNTKEVWFYDMRTNMRTFGVRTPLTVDDFNDFVKAYNAEDRHSVDDPRWTVLTREEIAAKGNSLDLGLMKDDSKKEISLSELVAQSEELLSEFKETMNSLESITSELKQLEE